MTLTLLAALLTPLLFGAKPDGKTLCTKPIQQAIDSAAKAGGGQVYLPPGRYLSGSIFLKSNVDLHLEAGAEIFGSPNAKDYTLVPKLASVDIAMVETFHLINAIGQQNIALTGRGTINGNCYAFWADTADMPRWIRHGDIKVKGNYGFMCEISNCQDVKIEGLTLKDSPEWTLHLWDCDRSQVRGIRILNNVFGPNTDGIDLSGCHDAVVTGCFIKTCDDAVCIKTFPNSRDSRHITVSDCVMETLCVALKLEESFKTSSDVTFANCVIYGASRAVGIYTFQGGTVENIMVQNIVAETNAPLVLNRPIHIGSWDNTGTGKVGTVRNVTISNFMAKTQGRIIITAAPGHKVENITLRDVRLDYAYYEDPKVYAEGIRSAQLKGVAMEAKAARAALIVDNVKNLKVENFEVLPPSTPEVPAAWRLPMRIENGSDRRHRPVYGLAAPITFAKTWIRDDKGKVKTIGMD